MNGHLALVVDQRGASLDMGSHETVVLTHADGRRERIGLRALGSVVLHGDVRLSTGLLRQLAAHGVALTTLMGDGRDALACFTCLPHRLAALRHRQHLAGADRARRQTLARAVVIAKLEAMADFARDHAPGAEDDQYRAMRSATAAADIASLMGVEGAATTRHFEVLREYYARGGQFAFNGRSRRPPKDAPNALMSLCYTLAQGLATRQAVHAGLDPQLGFLHGLQRNREGLSLDLLEPARAPLDAWVGELLSARGPLRPAHFTTAADGGVWLDKTGRSLFYPAWFREGHRLALPPMRRLLARLLRHLREAPPGADATDPSPASR